jgi:hypothetical protein
MEMLWALNFGVSNPDLDKKFQALAWMNGEISFIHPPPTPYPLPPTPYPLPPTPYPLPLTPYAAKAAIRPSSTTSAMVMSRLMARPLR